MFRAILCPSSGAQDCELRHVVCPQTVVGRRPWLQRHGLCVRCEGRFSNVWRTFLERVKDVSRTVKNVSRTCEGLSKNVLHTKHTVRASTIQASDRQQSGDIIPYAVIHNLALLRMGKELPETCWTNLKFNKLLLLHLVGHLLYL